MQASPILLKYAVPKKPFLLCRPRVVLGFNMKYRNCQHYSHPLVIMVQVLVCGVRGAVDVGKGKCPLGCMMAGFGLIG